MTPNGTPRNHADEIANARAYAAMETDTMTKEAQDILSDILSDRAIGTEDHWWQFQVGEFYLDEDFGAYDPQKAADKRRMIRLPTVERELTAALAREAGLREALEDAEYDLCQWLECGPELINAGFNMDGTAEVIAKARAALSVKP
jgi:hypothetical protein